MMEYYRSYTIIGNKLGRTIATPTLNLKIEQSLDLEFGVYVFEVILFAQKYYAVGTYGFRESVDQKLTLEVHILDSKFLHPELYYVQLAVRAIKFLRPMKKFAGLKALKQQLEIDKKLASNYVRTLA